MITNIKGKILAVTIAKGKMHDFRLFKNSNPTKKILMSRVLADLGYLGIDKICPNATIPNKNKKETSYKRREKENHKLSSNRIIIENINAKIKVFKITKYPYRNRRKRFGLRMNLICAIINLDLIPLNTDSGKD
ncbi:MAG: transposase family protein [Sulfurimonas sp.]|nr:transposase family protein [Sulfurimonas sp.]MDQ7062233.1 transposase family protein [Sulfurimonas sp.]